MHKRMLLALTLTLTVVNFYTVNCTGTHSKYVRHNYKYFPVAEEHRSLFVHLDNWTYEDIKKECANALGPNGYAAVQVSPVTAHAKDKRVSVSSYEIKNESGDEKQLHDMIKECNKHKVRVIIEVVLNNMMTAKDEPVCSDYKDLNKEKTYGTCGQPPMYYKKDFHDAGAISSEDYKTSIEKVRTGEFAGRHDLRQIVEGVPNVHMIGFLYKLIMMGAAGLKIVSADHMDPEELRLIYDTLPDVTFEKEPTRPFIHGAVWDPFHKNEWAIKDADYVKYTRVTDYKFAADLALAFKDHKIPIKDLQNWGEKDLRKSEDSVVFINTVMTQVFKNRGPVPYPTLGDHHFIDHDLSTDDKAFKLAMAFMLSYGHGIPMISSAYANSEQKPVDDEKDSVHRRKKVLEILSWRNEVALENGGTFPKIDKWQVHSKSGNQVAYCTGTQGFVVFNNEKPEIELDAEFETCFEKPGIYCDMFSGGLKNANGKTPSEVCGFNYIEVKPDKKAHFHLKSDEGLQLFNTKAAKLH